MRIVPCVALSLVLGACAAFSADSGPDKPADAADAGGSGEAGSAGDAGVGSADSGGDGELLDSGEAGPAPINCFGTPRAAFYCDDFEGPMLGVPPWALDVSSPDASITEFATSPDQHLGAGARSGDSYVGAGSTLKRAKARWTRPVGSGRGLALQLNVYIPADTWTKGDATTIATLEGSSGRVDLVFTANGAGSNGSLSVTLSGLASPSFGLGDVVVDDWMCVEIAADGTTVSGSRGAGSSVSFGSTIQPIAAELGIATTLADKVFYYDNVIFAPAAIGCP